MAEVELYSVYDIVPGGTESWAKTFARFKKFNLGDDPMEALEFCNGVKAFDQSLQAMIALSLGAYKRNYDYWKAYLRLHKWSLMQLILVYNASVSEEERLQADNTLCRWILDDEVLNNKDYGDNYQFVAVTIKDLAKFMVRLCTRNEEDEIENKFLEIYQKVLAPYKKSDPDHYNRKDILKIELENYEKNSRRKQYRDWGAW